MDGLWWLLVVVCLLRHDQPIVCCPAMCGVFAWCPLLPIRFLHCVMRTTIANGLTPLRRKSKDHLIENGIVIAYPRSKVRPPTCSLSFFLFLCHRINTTPSKEERWVLSSVSSESEYERVQASQTEEKRGSGLCFRDQGQMCIQSGSDLIGTSNEREMAFQEPHIKKK